MFLYIEEDKICITKEGMLIPEIIDLYKIDKSNAEKVLFRKWITFMFYAYKQDGVYQNMLPSKRVEQACKLSEVDIEFVKSNEKLHRAIKIYQDTQTTLNERLYNGVKDDIEATLDSIRQVPLKKQIYVEVTVNIPESANSSNTVPYNVKQQVEMINIEEKTKLLNMSEKLIELEERLRKKIIKEAQQKKGSQGRLFDSKITNA